jgi:glycosyltransferase involved in cell wall biosynthesis
MKVSMIIPCYNEKLSSSSWLLSKKHLSKKRVVLVDDASEDGTRR